MKSERKRPAKNRFQDSTSRPKFKTAIVAWAMSVAWAMCQGWWTEARNADERSVMQARGTKQHKLVEDTLWRLPWIESGSLVRDSWSAVEYGGIPEFLGRLKARGHALMAKWVQDILLGKNKKTKRFQIILKLDAVAVAMVVGIVSEMAVANECIR